MTDLTETLPVIRIGIQNDLAAGLSLRQSLRYFRERGGKLRTEDYAALWRDERRKAKRDAA